MQKEMSIPWKSLRNINQEKKKKSMFWFLSTPWWRLTGTKKIPKMTYTIHLISRIKQSRLKGRKTYKETLLSFTWRNCLFNSVCCIIMSLIVQDMKSISDKEKSPYFSAYSVLGFFWVLFCVCSLASLFFARRLTQDCSARKFDSADMICTNTTAADSQIWKGAHPPVVVSLLREMLIESYIPACNELLYIISTIHSNKPHKSAFSPAFCCIVKSTDL